MKILVLNHADVEQLLPIEECIEIMAGALAAVSDGQVYQPLRTIVRPPDALGLMSLMSAYRGGEQPLGALKAVCVFPGNSALGKDPHQGSVMLFDGTTGELLALLNATAITAIRTGAVSGVATRLLAREDAADLAIIGAGAQARTQLAAIAAVRPLRRARVTSRSLESARRFAEELAPRYPFPIEPVEGAEAAVRGADLIVTATNAAEPVVRRAWLAPGVHLNAVGSCIPTVRELDTATMADARIFVDRRELTLNELGDYLFAMREGLIGPEHIRAEIGEVVLGRSPGRTSAEEMTLFKSLGLAVEDLAAAEHVYRKAQDQGAGAWVEF